MEHDAVHPRGGKAEICHLVLLHPHIHVPQPAHQGRFVARRAVRQDRLTALACEGASLLDPQELAQGPIVGPAESEAQVGAGNGFLRYGA